MEVIVYQRGKVGSTSIVDALNRAGATAYQSHFLDTETFRNAIQRFANPQLPEESAHHLSHQLQRNLVLHNKVAKYLSRSGETGDKLGIVTLVRDPLDWFYSNLAQNIFDIRDHVRNWLGFVSGSEVGDIGADELILYLEELFACFMRHVTRMSSDIPEQMRTLFREAASSESGRLYRFFYGQVSNLTRPHFWFDHHWTPLFGIDVQNMDFDDISGRAFHESGNLRFMLIRFENLEGSADAMADFFGLKGLSLNRLNKTSDKATGNIVREARRRVTYPDGFKELFYTSDYCRKFYTC